MSIGTQLAAYDLGKEREQEKIIELIKDFFNENLDECMDDCNELIKRISQSTQEAKK